ncbi:MAG: glycosyltransferase family 2 protein [Planctomycetota bacterium]|nr:glycosyltransferase family 2 protein [Planctomycetota bacterium]MDA1179703.1 glycosyltransferase family 2 protein [Planctomycetota bacterium]
MQPNITVLITCKNELQHMPACLESVRPIADEILVADSGSRDGTLEFLREQADCRVIEREYVNAGNFKNWAIPQAKHEWILIVDADERITPALTQEIRNKLPGTRWDGFSLRRLNYFLGYPVRHGGWGRDQVIRLFRRDIGRYGEHTDHSEVTIPGNRLGQLLQRMPHFTCSSYDRYLEKMHRYAQQQAELWHRQGRKPSLTHLIGNGPMRFLRSYVAERGFLDGMPGLQIATLTAYYSFLKQSRLWALCHSRNP